MAEQNTLVGQNIFQGEASHLTRHALKGSQTAKLIAGLDNFRDTNLLRPPQIHSPNTLGCEQTRTTVMHRIIKYSNSILLGFGEIAGGRVSS